MTPIASAPPAIQNMIDVCIVRREHRTTGDGKPRPRLAWLTGPQERTFKHDRDVWHDPIVVGTWFKIALSHEQVLSGHVSRLEDAFGALFAAAGAPSGAALFGLPQHDGGESLYFTPRASALATRLLKANRGQPSDPPVDDGTVSLLIGHGADVRLLSS
jgi:hypothetical protein